MNHRERVCTALNHREPDRVPLDINGTTCTSLTKIAYENLREFLRLAVDENPQVSSRIMGSVRANEDLLLPPT